jgi:hypothetical protein
LKFIANPVEVEAFEILEVMEFELPGSDRERSAQLFIVEPESLNADQPTTGHLYVAGPGMTARYWPKPGDYLVRQSDGYEYLNPREVFERKYSRVTA